MTVHRTAALAARHLGSSVGPHSRRAARRSATISPAQGDRRPGMSTRLIEGRGWPLAAAVAGVAHAGAVASDGAWPTIGLAAATVLLAAVWPWLLAGHRQELSAALGVVWLAAAVAVAAPAPALLATAAGVAALMAACSVR